MDDTTAAPVNPQLPARGGSYLVRPDGSLERVESTEPAKGDLSPEPKAPAADAA